MAIRRASGAVLAAAAIITGASIMTAPTSAVPCPTDCRQQYDRGRRAIQSQSYEAQRRFDFWKAYLDKQVWRLGGPDVADQAEIDRLVEQAKKRIWNEVTRRERTVEMRERRVLMALSTGNCTRANCSPGYKTLVKSRARSTKATIKWDGQACIDEIMDIYGGMM